MHLDPFSERVLAAMRAGHALGVVETDRARSLVRSGLTLEQSVVGLGLVDGQTFGEYLGHAAGLPYVHQPTPLVGDFDCEPLNQSEAMPFAQEGASIHVAFHQPIHSVLIEAREALTANDQTLIPYVTTTSSFWSTRAEKRERTTGVLARIAMALRRARSRHARIVDQDGAGRAMVDGIRLIPLRMESTWMPAVAYRLKRLGPFSGWQSDVSHRGFTGALHLSRVASDTSDDHPMDWSSLEPYFRERPVGLTIIISGDPSFVRETFQQYQGRTETVPADTQDEQEQALHAALSGKAVTAWTMDRSAWWHPATAAGLRVRVLSAVPTTYGWAWSSYLDRV